MNNSNSSPSFLLPSPVQLHCPLCSGMFPTYYAFLSHLEDTHPSPSERNAILCTSHVYASSPVLQGNQPSAPQHPTSQINNNVVFQPTLPSNFNHPIRSDRAPPTESKQMEIGIGGSNSNEIVHDCTIPLINQLDVPISSNADEIVNIAEQQNDLDLNLRL